MARQRAAIGTLEQGTFGNVSSEGIFDTVLPRNDEQGIFVSGNCDQPVSSRIRHSFFPNSLSVSPSGILNL